MRSSQNFALGNREIYEGVKFKVKFIGKQILCPDKIAQLIEGCAKFYQLGVLEGNFGNLSHRVKGQSFIITGAGVGLSGKIKEDDFTEVLRCDLKRKIAYARGGRLPSSETFMHFLIYKSRKDIDVVFHGHSQALLKKKGLPSTKSILPYGTLELAQEVCTNLGREKFLIIKEHGFVSVGKTIDELINIITSLLWIS